MFNVRESVALCRPDRSQYPSTSFDRPYFLRAVSCQKSLIIGTAVRIVHLITRREARGTAEKSRSNFSLAADLIRYHMITANLRAIKNVYILSPKITYTYVNTNQTTCRDKKKLYAIMYMLHEIYFNTKYIDMKILISYVNLKS